VSANQSVLIVGATGNLGTRLIRQLAAAGIKPRALVHSREKAAAIVSYATPIFGDLLVPETLVEAFRGAERVFIVAPPKPEMETLERNAIDAAIVAGARRIVYLSNFTARVGSELPPMHIHGLHERLIASLGIEWTVLGPTRYMTSLPFNWPPVLNEGLLFEASGSGTITCVDPDDVAAVAMKALNEDGHNGKTYRLTSEDAFTAQDLAELLTKTLGHDVKVFKGDDRRPPITGKYFDMVAAGLYKTTNTLGTILGRKPVSYAEWLARNLPDIRARAA
jgi:uncharacterized protein YbjT (DUF2867 family)